ncbi:MAG: hypothetical protein R2684_04010 [Pyrinomonadaceae bacterium]
MPKLRIVGFETGHAKVTIREILVSRLNLDEKEAERMNAAVVDGRGITLEFEDEETAVGLGQELVEAGAKVELT